MAIFGPAAAAAGFLAKEGFSEAAGEVLLNQLFEDDPSAAERAVEDPSFRNQVLGAAAGGAGFSKAMKAILSASKKGSLTPAQVSQLADSMGLGSKKKDLLEFAKFAIDDPERAEQVLELTEKIPQSRTQRIAGEARKLIGEEPPDLPVTSSGRERVRRVEGEVVSDLPGEKGGRLQVRDIDAEGFEIPPKQKIGRAGLEGEVIDPDLPRGGSLQSTDVPTTGRTVTPTEAVLEAAESSTKGSSDDAVKRITQKIDDVAKSAGGESAEKSGLKGIGSFLKSKPGMALAGLAGLLGARSLLDGGGNDKDKFNDAIRRLEEAEAALRQRQREDRSKRAIEGATGEELIRKRPLKSDSRQETLDRIQQIREELLQLRN